MMSKGLYNNILILDYVASNVHVVNECWVGKDVKGSDDGLFHGSLASSC
jgi:hypothetical protein